MNNESFRGKTLAITGIGGFIGARMTERATELGMRVRGLDASPAAADAARRLGAEVVVGDVNDGDAVARASHGADVMFHTAAIIEEDGVRSWRFPSAKGCANSCSSRRSWCTDSRIPAS
jgi:nucleoside-diphosphate-sugar epimerase